MLSKLSKQPFGRHYNFIQITKSEKNDLESLISLPTKFYAVYRKDVDYFNLLIKQLLESDFNDDHEVAGRMIEINGVLEKLLHQDKHYILNINNKIFNDAVAKAFTFQYIQNREFDLHQVEVRLESLPNHLRNMPIIVDQLHQLTNKRKDEFWSGAVLVRLLSNLQPESIFRVLKDIKDKGHMKRLIMTSSIQNLDSHGVIEHFPRKSTEPFLANKLLRKLENDQIVYLLENEETYSNITSYENSYSPLSSLYWSAKRGLSEVVYENKKEPSSLPIRSFE